MMTKDRNQSDGWNRWWQRIEIEVMNEIDDDKVIEIEVMDEIDDDKVIEIEVMDEIYDDKG